MLIISSIQYLCGECCGCCKTKTDDKTKSTEHTPPNKTKTLGGKTSTQPDKTTEPDNSGDRSNDLNKDSKPSTKEPNDLGNKAPDDPEKAFSPRNFKQDIVNLTKCTVKATNSKVKNFYTEISTKAKNLWKGKNSDQIEGEFISEFKGATNEKFFIVARFEYDTEKEIKGYYKTVMNEDLLNDVLNNKEWGVVIKFEKHDQTTFKYTISYYPKSE